MAASDSQPARNDIVPVAGGTAVRLIALALVLGAGAGACAVALGSSETTTAQVAAPSLDGKIVFLRYQVPAVIVWDIYAMSAAGGGQTDLTSGDAEDRAPDWSPDGERIAFTRFRATPGSAGILVMNKDGSGERVLTNFAEDRGPDWSPDGTKIAFSRRDRDEFSEIFVMNADGSGPTNLTNSEAIWNFSPTWSPDGTKIAFGTSRGTNRNYEIFLMNPDGTGLTNLTNNMEPDSEPAWSPDGKQIAFARSLGYGKGEIFVMNADGSGQRNLTNNPADDESPAWSPDGAKIAFSTNRGTGGNDEIFVMNADGSSLTNLTRSVANDLEPDWAAQPLGPPLRRCVVPRVVGQTLRTARMRIRRANCSVGRIRYARSAMRRGRIVRQSLSPGVRRPRGASIDLVVSRGR
jgi:Tol biopolymer transport system component